MSALKSLLAWPAAHPARAGTLGGWFQQGCGMLVALMLIPVVTKFLTPSEAGIWFAFQGLVSMIGLLDLGFGFAISRQAAFTLGATEKTIAKDDFLHLAHGWAGVAQLFRLTRVLYRWLAVAAAGLGIILFEVFSRFGNLVPEGTPGVRACWYAMAAASCLLIMTAGQSAFLNGIGAVYQTRFFAGLYQLAAGAGAGFAAWLGWGLPAMGTSFAVCAVGYRVVIGFVRHECTRPMREVADVSPSEGSLARLARAALPVGGVNVFGSLVYTVQSPLLGMLLGPENVAPFYLAQKIASAFNMLSMQVVLPRMPFFTKSYSAGNYVGARLLMKQSLLFGTMLVAASAVLFFLFSPLFAHVLLNRIIYIDHITLALMAIDLFLLGSTVIWAQFVLASGHNPFVVPTIFNSLVSLTLSVLLIPKFGIAALPAATIIAGTVFNYRLSILHGLKTMKTISSQQSQIFK